MSDLGDHPALVRITSRPGYEDIAALLDRLSGTDLTTLLLDVARARAARSSPSRVLAQYGRDRFVVPAPIPFDALRAVENLVIDAVGADFEFVTLAPVVPLGTHAVLGSVDQNRLVTTVRGTEVAADPTAALALEAAVRRTQLLADDQRSAGVVRLAAIGRVLRAQLFSDPDALAHFSLLGLVSSGRATGRSVFERHTLLEHLRTLVGITSSAGADRIVIRVTDFDGGYADVVDDVVADLQGESVTVEPWPERTAGRGYYPGLCFKLLGTWQGIETEVGDGGMVPWSQRLVQSRKERMMTSGISLDRLATLRSGAGGQASS